MWALNGFVAAAQSPESHDQKLCSRFWPLQVQVGDSSLRQKLEVENTGNSAFDFTTALHTYLCASSITQVTGLKLLHLSQPAAWAQQIW